MAEQAAWVLNCQPHDIPALVGTKLLKPPGNPPANGIKFFATVDLLESTKDRNWLVRMSATIYQHWQKQNASKKSRAAMSLPNVHAAPAELLPAALGYETNDCALRGQAGAIKTVV